MTDKSEGSQSSKKSWQGRLQEDADEATAIFLASLDVDYILWPYDIRGSLAHAQMLSECGIITADEFAKIKKGLESIGDDLNEGRIKLSPELEDIHMVIEKALIDRIGEPGKKLHTGRSRNDQVALDLRLWAADMLTMLMQGVVDLQSAFVELAAKCTGVVMPAYTHLQRAQPIVASQAMLAYVEMLGRDVERLEDCLDRTLVCPLGSGAVAGTSLPLKRQRTAELLGFDEISRNSIDAVSDRDFLVELLFDCSLLGVHLSRWCEDWIIYSTTEFGFISIADKYCTSSSMMPQKRNADTLELIRGKSACTIGQLVGLLTLIKGLPLAYNRDLQDDKRFVVAAMMATMQSLEVAEGIVSTARLNEERIAAGLDEGFLDATNLAEYFVRAGMPFRAAHHAVGKLVAKAEQQKLTLAKLPLSEFQAACQGAKQDVYDWLGAGNVVKRYTVEGGAGIEQVKKQIAHWRKELGRK